MSDIEEWRPVAAFPKLTDDDIRAIRRLRTTGLAQEKIASQFGVGQSAISSILRGETWGHVK